MLGSITWNMAPTDIHTVKLIEFSISWKGTKLQICKTLLHTEFIFVPLMLEILLQDLRSYRPHAVNSCQSYDRGLHDYSVIALLQDQEKNNS
jgi:hypothetical protein